MLCQRGFYQISLRAKIMLLVSISLVGMIVQISLSAFETRRNLNEAHQQQIESVTQALYNTIAGFQANEAAGTLTHEQAQAAALEAASHFRYGGKDGKTEYFYIYTLGGVNVFHIKKEFIGQDLREKIRDGKGGYPVKDLLAAIANQPSAFVESAFPRSPSEPSVPKLQYVMKFEPWGWMIGTGVWMDQVQAEFEHRLLMDLSLAVVILLVLSAASYVIGSVVIRQVGGEPGEAIDIMSRVAAGDLTARVPAAPSGSMLHSLGQMVESMRGMVSDISQRAVQLVGGAAGINTASQEISSASTLQAEATTSMAAAIEEMTVSITHISDNSHESEENSIRSVQLAEEGASRVELASNRIHNIADHVNHASEGIKKLETRAEQISSITGVIKEIAGQTSLLALNAAIEAARAGETGRGFSVVADEVRKLAERTAAATIEIENMVAGIQSDTNEVVDMMDATLPEVQAGVQATAEAAESLRQIQSGTRQTLEHVRDVSTSTREQSMASTSIAQKVEEISVVVDTNAHAIKQTACTAAEMEKIAGELNRLIARFRY
jgi:methyl-accepting chemotaxis protein